MNCKLVTVLFTVSFFSFFIFLFSNPANAENITIDLIFNQEEYEEGDLVLLSAKLSSPLDTVLTFEIQDPDGNLFLILSNKTNSEGISSITFRLKEDGFGNYNIYVSSNSSLVEGSTIKLNVKEMYKPLSFSSSDITVSKLNPDNNEIIQLFALIHSHLDFDVSANVKFYEELTENDNSFLDFETMIIPARSSIAAKIDYQATYGIHLIKVIVETEDFGSISASRHFNFSSNVQSILVLYVGDINIFRFEPHQERTISVQVTCYLQNVDNVHLIVLDDQNITINASITPHSSMKPGDTMPFYLRIRAPELINGNEKIEKNILIQVVGNNNIFSNSEELTIIVAKDAIDVINPKITTNLILIGILSSISAFALSIKLSENLRYFLLTIFAIPFYSKISKSRILDHFHRGRIYNYIEEHPGATFTEIKTALKLPNGVTAFHLKMLEDKEMIKSKKEGLKRRYYLKEVNPENIIIKTSDTFEKVIEFIEKNPNCDIEKIRKGLKLESNQTAYYHVNNLIREGIVKKERKNKKYYYVVIEDDI